jgi:GNAT superfamily N-acetyltransferase
MFTIVATPPGAVQAGGVVRAYMLDVASRWYGRAATPEEVDRALRDEPYDDLEGSTGVLLVTMEDDQAIGCAGVRFNGTSAELTKVFALPSHRGRGAASQLLDAAEEACRDRGISTLRLDTRAALQEACALYERSGFIRVEAFNDDPYSDRWYSKALEGGTRSSSPRPCRRRRDPNTRTRE